MVTAALSTERQGFKAHESALRKGEREVEESITSGKPTQERQEQLGVAWPREDEREVMIAREFGFGLLSQPSSG